MTATRVFALYRVNTAFVAAQRGDRPLALIRSLLMLLSWIRRILKKTTRPITRAGRSTTSPSR